MPKVKVQQKKMKTLLQAFTDEEMQRIKAVKGKTTWHSFILELTDKKPNSFLTNKEKKKSENHE